jgi:hypothetical protein
MQRGDCDIVTVELLYEVWWRLFPWPEQEARAPDRYGRGRCRDERGRTRALGGGDDVVCTVDVDAVRAREQRRVPLVEEDDCGRVKDGERLGGRVGRPRLGERGVAGRGVGDIAGDKFDERGAARGEVWPSGLAQVEDADVRGVFTTMEEVKDDPTANKPCLREEY